MESRLKKFRVLALCAGLLALGAPAAVATPAFAEPSPVSVESAPWDESYTPGADVEVGDTYGGAEVLSVVETPVGNAPGGLCDQIRAIDPSQECELVSRLIEVEDSSTANFAMARASATCQTFWEEKSAVGKVWGFAQEVRWCYNGSKAWVHNGSPKGFQDCSKMWGVGVTLKLLSCGVRSDGTAKATAAQSVSVSVAVKDFPAQSTCYNYAHLTKSGGRTFERPFC